MPYDVICCIIGHLDLDTLKTASLVTRDFQYEADKYLWKSFRIYLYEPGDDDDYDNYALIIERCHFAYHLATCIRNFEVRVDINGWRLPARETRELLDKLFYSLRRFTGLQRLELDIPDLRRRVDPVDFFFKYLNLHPSYSICMITMRSMRL